MNIKKKTTKIIICYIASLVMIVMANLGFLAITKTNQLDFVSASGENMLQVSISNSNFNSNTSSSYPYAPNSYDVYNYNTKLSSSDTKPVSAGVINLQNSKYSSKFSNALRGNNLDSYVLMIDSSKEVGDETVYNTANFGYRTSSAISMSANSNYMVTADVFTLNNTGIGSLYLYNDDGTVFSKIENINSYNQWTTYTFFVSTADTSLNLKLGMYLNGAGIVLFDNISCYQLSNTKMNTLMSALDSKLYKHTDNVDNIIKEFVVDDNMFKYMAENSNEEVYSIVGAGGLGDTSLLQTTTNTDGTHTNALLIEIDENNKSFMQYSTPNNFLTFEQNLLYKVNITLKTEKLSGNANLQLVQTEVDAEDAINSEVIKITSNTSSNVNNNYQTYSFYINGHPTENSTYKLIFGLGDNETATSGKLYISSIAVTKTNYSTYSSASTGTTAEKIDLTKNETYSSSSIYLDNANFNAIQIADYNKPWPATPTAWTVSTGTGVQKYGVINPSVCDLTALGLTNPINPFTNNSNNNVLMMYNASNDTLSYTSSTKSLTANTYHCFTVEVQTQNANAKLSLVSTINNKEVELVSKTVSTDDLNSQEWKTISLYIHTGNQDIDVALKITHETTNGYGYTYIDNTSFDYLQAPTQEEFETKLNAQTNIESNFVAVDLNNIFNSSNLLDQWNTPTFFFGNADSGVKYGIVNSNGDQLLNEVIAYEEYLPSFKAINGEAIGIRSTKDVNYTVTSNIGFDLTANSFYKIVVKVYTQNISANDPSIENSKLGAQIKLSSFDDKFTQILSDNVWTEYTFFIKPSDDTTTYLELSLGNEDVACKGDVYFGGITSETIEEDEYNSAKANPTTKVLNTTANKSTDDDSTDNSTTNESTNSSNNSAWIYAIPSLLFALSIIIAVVWVLARKIKFTKPRKKSKNAYDRNSTVSKQYYMRKATMVREEKLRELEKEIEELNQERSKYEEEYKHDLTKLRELKIKRANPSDINKLEKDMKKNQKISSQIGVNLNRVTAEIEYIKTDAYINSLMKKLANEQHTQNKESNENE